MATLKNGDRIPLTESGQSVQILSFIAEGGQGEVYRVAFNGGEYALKWYSKLVPSDAFYRNLAHNVRMQAPSEQFLWPLALTEKRSGRFGYVMRLCPPDYAEFGEFLLGHTRFASWDALLVAALNIVEGYLALHSIGYSYQDLNEGSFFINPDSGDVLICDNDNVAPDKSCLGIKGTPRYMAPEVVLNESAPNVQTDRFSLAVILFRLFYIDHPLEGRHTVQFPLTDETGAELFGRHPVFIYDPHDKSNRPVPDVHQNVIRRRYLFPPDLTAAFTEAFTKGLKEPNCRLLEKRWLEVLLKARGMLVQIEGREQFVNAYSPDTLPEGCRLLRTEEQLIALTPGSVLYACQLDRTTLDYKTPAAVVRESKSDSSIYGMGNLTDRTWVVTLPGQQPREVRPRSFAPLLPGTLIDFGTIRAKVF